MFVLSKISVTTNSKASNSYKRLFSKNSSIVWIKINWYRISKMMNVFHHCHETYSQTMRTIHMIKKFILQIDTKFGNLNEHYHMQFWWYLMSISINRRQSDGWIIIIIIQIHINIFIFTAKGGKTNHTCL